MSAYRRESGHRASVARMSRQRVHARLRGLSTGVNALRDALWRHPGPTNHGPTTSPGSTAYASARTTPRDDALAFAMRWPLQACYPGFRFANPGYLL